MDSGSYAMTLANHNSGRALKDTPLKQHVIKRGSGGGFSALITLALLVNLMKHYNKENFGWIVIFMSEWIKLLHLDESCFHM